MCVQEGLYEITGTERDSLALIAPSWPVFSLWHSTISSIKKKHFLGLVNKDQSTLHAHIKVLLHCGLFSFTAPKCIVNPSTPRWLCVGNKIKVFINLHTPLQLQLLNSFISFMQKAVAETFIFHVCAWIQFLSYLRSSPFASPLQSPFWSNLWFIDFSKQSWGSIKTERRAPLQCLDSQ